MRDRFVSPGLTLLVALSAPMSRARADETTGTWTGEVQLHTHYYWETSTRVLAPEVALRVTSPEGVDIRASYLVDAITSASIAAGAQEDIRFTEVRNQGTLGVGHEFDLGDAQLRVDATGHLSHEPDYLATGINTQAALSLNQRATVVNTSLSYIYDEVGALLRGGMPRVDSDGRDLSDRGRQGELEGFTASVGLSQALSPIATLSAGYQLVHNWGYLQNPYRRAAVGGALLPEVHPGARTRHAVYGRLAAFLPATESALHLLYRAYLDDWDVGAITPEARLYQMIGDGALIRLRYRFFIQTRSFFQALEYSAPQAFVTADPKMDDFSSHLVGLSLRLALRFLAGGVLSFLERAWLSMSFNYWLQTSRFGDGVIVQTGLRAPF